MLPRLAALFAVVLAAAAATPASAVTLVVESDKLTYAIGESIVLTITGDPQGGSDDAISGRLLYSAALTDTVTSSQTQHTRGGGTILALTGTLIRGDGFADVFLQLIDVGGTPRTVDQIQIATATLTAQAVGTVSVDWLLQAGNPGLDFFGITSGPGASFTIVPEPAAIALLGLGLVALAARRRTA